MFSNIRRILQSSTVPRKDKIGVILFSTTSVGGTTGFMYGVGSSLKERYELNKCKKSHEFNSMDHIFYPLTFSLLGAGFGIMWPIIIPYYGAIKVIDNISIQTCEDSRDKDTIRVEQSDVLIGKHYINNKFE